MAAFSSIGHSNTQADLRAELNYQDLPRHLALFYDTPSEQMNALTPFLEYGLTTNQKCICLLDVNSPARIRQAFHKRPIDIEHHIEAGDLELRDASEVYLDAGFNPDQMIQTLKDTSEETLRAGYDGLFIAGENSWCFHTEMDFDPILDFEAEFDAVCPDLPIVALCQYDLTQFGEASAAKALWTHEKIIYRDTLCENPFYIPPAEYRSDADAHLNAKLMLEQAHSLAQSQRQINRHKQRLEVVDRILRHNIRNDLNVVQLHLESLREAGVDTADDERKLDVALQHVTRVLDFADKGRYVQETLEDPNVGPVHLGTAITTAVEEISTTFPDAEITITGPQDLSVLGDTNIDVAIREALMNGIIHQERKPPSITLTVSSTDDSIRMDVTNPGSIPEIEQRSVQEETESSLTHGSGLGLWLIKWIVENSQGSLTFPDSETDAILRIELSRVPT